MQLTQYGGAKATHISLIDAPVAGTGQIGERVHAAGVSGLDWKVRGGYVMDAFLLVLPTAQGVDLPGVVEQVGVDVTRFAKGDSVTGSLRGLDAYANMVAVDVANLAYDMRLMMERIKEIGMHIQELYWRT